MVRAGTVHPEDQSSGPSIHGGSNRTPATSAPEDQTSSSGLCAYLHLKHFKRDRPSLCSSAWYPRICTPGRQLCPTNQTRLRTIPKSSPRCWSTRSCHFEETVTSGGKVVNKQVCHNWVPALSHSQGIVYLLKKYSRLWMNFQRKHLAMSLSFLGWGKNLLSRAFCPWDLNVQFDTY